MLHYCCTVKLKEMNKITTIHNSVVDRLKSEPMFEIFKHRGLFCCVQRINWSGVLNGYVAVNHLHPLHGRGYGDTIRIDNPENIKFNRNYISLFIHALDCDREDDEISVDLLFNVHGGITYSDETLNGIEGDVLGENLWWFGFDTAHSGDIQPFQSHIDREYPSHGEYRDFEYVKKETTSLADQLVQFQKELIL